MKRYFIFSVLTIAAWTGLLAPQVSEAAANTPQIDPAYNSRIIDDGVFLNSGSMSAADIQNFLNSKVPSCDTNHQGGLAQYPPPYTCLKDYVDPTTGKRAAQLIYDEAIGVGLNPQVILTTLEKEQSLVRDTWPYPSQYKSAMGYGCPESQSVCDSQYYGFYNQVHLGARLLRAGLARDCGDTSTLSNWSVDAKWRIGSTTAVDGVPTYLGTCATGALYNYTPHRPDSAYTARGGTYYYGNYNFVTLFTSWFGSTWGSPLVKSPNSPAIYLIDNGARYLIPSYDVMKAYGLYGAAVNNVQDSTIAGFTDGGTLGTLVKWNQDGTVFLIDSGRRYAIGDAATCTNWALSCFDAGVVKTLSNGLVGGLANGGAMQPMQENNGTVYLMSAGKRNPILDAGKIASLGYNWTNVIHMENLNSQQPLGPLLMSNGTVIKFPSSNGIFVYDNDTFHLVPSFDVLNAWGLGPRINTKQAASSYNMTAPTAADSLGVFTKDAGGATYLLDSGRRLDITARLSDWPAGTPAVIAPTLLASLPASPMKGAIRSASGAIYTVQGAKKHLVTTSRDLAGLGINGDTLSNVSAYSAGFLPEGAPALAEGAIFQAAGTPGIYLYNAGSRLLIPSPNYFSYFGLSWGEVEVVDATALTYADGGNLSVLITSGAGSKYNVFGGNKIALSSQNLTDWGLSSATYVSLSDANLARLVTKTMTKFARTPNGAIYLGGGGTAHPVTSYSAFLQQGGTGANTTNVSEESLAASPVGSSY